MQKSASDKVPETEPLKKKKVKDDKKSKHKLTFLDKIEPGAELTRTHYVLSFKNYNAKNTYDPFEQDETTNSSHCCTTF